MSDLRYMDMFNDKNFYTEDEKDIIESYSCNKDLEALKQALLDNEFSCIKDFASNAQTLKELIILKRAYSLGPEYAEAISKDLDEEEQSVALYGFQKEINVIEQIKGGELLENLILLIDASAYDDFVLRDYFDPTGSYLNYTKIAKFLQNSK